jgi:hypothetical protein
MGEVEMIVLFRLLERVLFRRRIERRAIEKSMLTQRRLI